MQQQQTSNTLTPGSRVRVSFVEGIPMTGFIVFADSIGILISEDDGQWFYPWSAVGQVELMESYL